MMRTCLNLVACIAAVLGGGALVSAPAFSPRSAAAADLSVLTADDNVTIPRELMVVRLTGEITPGTTEDLRRAWSSRGVEIGRLLLDLESIGGELIETEKIIAFIEGLRQSARVDTLVRHGAICASACVGIFAQGERRSAGGASVWVFHGVCPPGSTIPSFAATCRGLDLLRKAGVKEEFLQMLLRDGYLSRPGALWLSGYELYRVHDAGLITRLLEAWQPDYPADIGPPSGISAQ
ncbi:MAG TPA: hypothetical protein GX405_16390 [Rhizobiales bacterium]|nr:hypothetical protein [Hyphomicrobiales bacterium]